MYMKFSRFPEGFSPSHFLFAEFFARFPHFFKKFFVPVPEDKKAPTAPV